MNTSLRLTVTHLIDDASTPQGWKLSGVVDDADATVALFPKSVGLKATTLRSRDGVFPFVNGHAQLLANGANGGINETGLRRLRAALKAADKAGIEVEYDAAVGNAYATLADALTALGIE